MDTNTRYELYQIKNELQSIIGELDNIAYGVRKDFFNIGSEDCAACIMRVADKYRMAKRKLDHIDTKKVTEEFAASHSGGGFR